MTPEGKVKQQVKKILATIGGHYFMPVSNGMGTMGTPDFLCCVRGRFLAIETKADASKKPTALQTKAASKVISSGGIALLIHSGNIQTLERTLTLIMESRDEHTIPSVWPTTGSSSRSGGD